LSHLENLIGIKCDALYPSLNNLRDLGFRLDFIPEGVPINFLMDANDVPKSPIDPYVPCVIEKLGSTVQPPFDWKRPLLGT
jgi:hypothetical protein